MYSRTIAHVELMFLLIKPTLNKVYFTLLYFTLFIGSHNMLRRKPICCHVVLLGHNELQISVPQRDVL